MSELKEVVVVSGVRLPVGSYGGSLKNTPAIDMGAMVVKEAVKRAGIEPSVVDEVIIGQVGEVAENGFVARAISLKAGMPKETTAYSVNRQCGSGLQSIVEAVMEIQTGQADVVVAGGLHLGKAQPAALPAHVVNVHQLGVHLVVAAGDDVGQRVGRVQ